MSFLQYETLISLRNGRHTTSCLTNCGEGERDEGVKTLITLILINTITVTHRHSDDLIRIKRVKDIDSTEIPSQFIIIMVLIMETNKVCDELLKDGSDTNYPNEESYTSLISVCLNVFSRKKD